jgi:2-alkyl-3-oxoalkanoate reductase
MALRDELGPCLVTGGGGFLGGALVRRLREQGYRVTSASRGHYPALDALGVRQVRLDLAEADPRQIDAAVEGHSTLFHVAALTGAFGPKAPYWRTNAEGTTRLLDGARRAGVRRFVHTSSPSVVFDGADHLDAGPELPYPRRYLAHYPASKAAAERAVLAANGQDGLVTCALRPHLVFGPGDPHLLPKVLERARAGRLPVVGRGDNLVSLTYVDNAAHAHLCAARRLDPEQPEAAPAGRAYFVNQEEPVALWPWLFELFGALGVPLPKRRLPRRVAYGAGALCEALWRALPLPGEPPMSRFVALQLASSHTYDMGPARRDLGYTERVGLDEATQRTIEDLARRFGDPASQGASKRVGTPLP